MTDAVVPVSGAALAAQITELEQELQAERSRLGSDLAEIDQEIAKVVAPFRKRRRELSDVSHRVRSEISNRKQELVERLKALQSQCHHVWQIPLQNLENGYRLWMMELPNGVHLIDLDVAFNSGGLQSAPCLACNLSHSVCPFCGHFLESDRLVDKADAYLRLKLWWSQWDGALERDDDVAKLEAILGLEKESIPSSNFEDAVVLMKVPVIAKSVRDYQIQSMSESVYLFSPFLMSGKNGLEVETWAIACPGCQSRLRTWRTEGVNDWVDEY